jgi:hypothetical protein
VIQAADALPADMPSPITTAAIATIMNFFIVVLLAGLLFPSLDEQPGKQNLRQPG